ncbi:MAG: nickel pincer cofactor biosynthesis protein LarB [Planctomycetota bacterium]
MNRKDCLNAAQQLLAGNITPEQLADQLLAALGTATGVEHALSVDMDRSLRCGFPEVIYGEGKTVGAILAAAAQLLDRGERVLATRVSPEQAEEIRQERPEAVYNSVARTLRSNPLGDKAAPVGRVAVVTAGTTDLPVAEEALVTLEWMGVAANAVHDVGVAGPHRLPERLGELAGSDAIVVVAGMEGALPSVVGGYVDCPVIAVPTSVGYGANFGGASALLSMLNSCASNVAVVNIDAGFKGGYVAGMIARRSSQSCAESSPAEPSDRGEGGDARPGA